MKNFLLILALAVTFNASAQKNNPPFNERVLYDITFTISAVKGSFLQPVKNDSMVWSVWIEPIGNVNDSVLFSDRDCNPGFSLEKRFAMHGQSPDFTVFDQGSTTVEYATIELGIHHILVENKFTGKPHAYITILIDYLTATHYHGSSERITCYDVDDAEFASYAPYHKGQGYGEIDGLFLQGLLN